MIEGEFIQPIQLINTSDFDIIYIYSNYKLINYYKNIISLNDLY